METTLRFSTESECDSTIFLLYLSAMRNLSRSASNTPESSLLSSASYNTAHSMSFATAQDVQQEVTLSPATQNQRHHQHRQQRHHDFVAIDSVDGKLHRCCFFSKIPPRTDALTVMVHSHCPHTESANFTVGLGEWVLSHILDEVNEQYCDVVSVTVGVKKPLQIGGIGCIALGFTRSYYICK